MTVVDSVKFLDVGPEPLACRRPFRIRVEYSAAFDGTLEFSVPTPFHIVPASLEVPEGAARELNHDNFVLTADSPASGPITIECTLRDAMDERVCEAEDR